jgi:RNA polymerase sigma factor (sigma-70 family)
MDFTTMAEDLPLTSAPLPSEGRRPQGEDLIPTRESLLSRLKDWRDAESWQDFFDTYWRLIYGVARKAGLSDAEAQDIVQETVLSVARKIEGFRYDPKVCSFKTWMLNLTRWRILNQLKRREREKDASRPSESGGTPDLPSDRTDTVERIADPAGCALETMWDTEWEQNLLAAALERVKRQVAPEQFQIFDLACLEGWPVRKVTKALGVNAARVYLAKHRIGALLKKEIKKLQARR